MKTALYNKKGVFVREYKSISDLARFLELPTSNVSLSIKRNWVLRSAYYAKVFEETYKEKITVSEYKLGKELRCFKLSRGKLKFYRKFKNLVEAADFVGMNHRTFTRKVKNNLLIENKNKSYRFRFVNWKDKTNHVPNHNVKGATGIDYGQQKIPIKLIDKHDNEFIFESVAEAVRKLDLNRVAILHVLAGRQKRTFGFKVEKLVPPQ